MPQPAPTPHPLQQPQRQQHPEVRRHRRQRGQRHEQARLAQGDPQAGVDGLWPASRGGARRHQRTREVERLCRAWRRP
ncbi:hypothetical protein H6G65_04280 [Microcystis elabens FACHB-917]|nr:hypothetical protein [Microcystis elabens FACHB-917]